MCLLRDKMTQHSFVFRWKICYHKFSGRPMLPNNFTGNIPWQTSMPAPRTEKNLWKAFAGESQARSFGHPAMGTAAPKVCPVCAHLQSYFEVRKENY